MRSVVVCLAELEPTPWLLVNLANISRVIQHMRAKDGLLSKLKRFLIKGTGSPVVNANETKRQCTTSN